MCEEQPDIVKPSLLCWEQCFLQSTVDLITKWILHWIKYGPVRECCILLWPLWTGYKATEGNREEECWDLWLVSYTVFIYIVVLTSSDLQMGRSMKHSGCFAQNNQVQFLVSIIPGTQSCACQKGQRLNRYQTNCISSVYVFHKQKEQTLAWRMLLWYLLVILLLPVLYN